MKSQIFNKEHIYNKLWDDNDIIKFKYYLQQGKLMYPKLPDNIHHTLIEHQINVEKGLIEDIKYNDNDDRNIKIETPFFEEIKTIIEDEN